MALIYQFEKALPVLMATYTVLLQGLVDAVNGFLNSKDNTLHVESSRGNENIHKTFDLVEVLTHSNIHIIIKM